MKYEQATDRQAMFIFFGFGFYILLISIFDKDNTYVPLWTLLSISGIFLTSGLTYLLPKEDRNKYSLYFITAINILIITSLYGIGFYGTGKCTSSILGFTKSHANCNLPGYIGIFWAIIFVIYFIKRLVKYFNK
ncbi:MAG: hypothetical protein RLZZ230_909 [Candidatus Parcubacteria bacterium]|jgi:hypothetical protein